LCTGETLDLIWFRRRWYHGVALFLKALPRFLMVFQKRRMESQLATAQSVGFRGARYTMVSFVDGIFSQSVGSCRSLAASLGVYECDVRWSMPFGVGTVLLRTSLGVARLWGHVHCLLAILAGGGARRAFNIGCCVSWRCRPCGVEFLL
jgi:hypothetical protein